MLLVLLLQGFFPHQRRPRFKGYPNYGADERDVTLIYGDY